MPRPMKEIDLTIEPHGSVYLFRPLTEPAKKWLEENTETEGWQWFGGALAVEHRYARDLCDGATGDGLVVA